MEKVTDLFSPQLFLFRLRKNYHLIEANFSLFYEGKSLLNILPWRAEEGCFTRTSVDGDGDGEALAAAGPSDKPEIAELGNLVQQSCKNL